MTTPAALESLALIRAAVEYLSSDEMSDAGQDRSLVLEMSQAMLGDLIEIGELAPLALYVGRWCDVLDNPEADSERIAAEITESLGT